MWLGYFLNDFQIVPLATITAGIAFIFYFIIIIGLWMGPPVPAPPCGDPPRLLSPPLIGSSQALRGGHGGFGCKWTAK